ncbi:hypothetical protein C3L33_13256, partial [Rhododendron williamsianum]
MHKKCIPDNIYYECISTPTSKSIFQNNFATSRDRDPDLYTNPTWKVWSLANSRSESSIGRTSGSAPHGKRVSPTVHNTRVSRASASKAPLPVSTPMVDESSLVIVGRGTTAGTCEDQANTSAHTGEQPSTSKLVIGHLAFDNFVTQQQHTTESVLPLTEPNCVHIDGLGANSSVVVVRDVHGQLHDLIFLLRDARVDTSGRALKAEARGYYTPLETLSCHEGSGHHVQPTLLPGRKFASESNDHAATPQARTLHVLYAVWSLTDLPYYNRSQTRRTVLNPLWEDSNLIHIDVLWSPLNEVADDVDEYPPSTGVENSLGNDAAVSLNLAKK